MGSLVCGANIGARAGAGFHVSVMTNLPQRPAGRMQGLVGYDELPPPLRLLSAANSPSTDWFECRSHLGLANADTIRGVLSSLEPEQARPLGIWLNDDCPKLRGSRYARFFWDLDVWTEYWDIYHPETHGPYYFGEPGHPGYLASFLPSP